VTAPVREKTLFFARHDHFTKTGLSGQTFQGKKTLTRRAFFAGSYAVGVARSKYATGPYEKYKHNPILASNTGAEGFDGTGAKKTLFCAPFSNVDVKNDHFAKTGLGQM
jgi:hypothetical protein